MALVLVCETHERLIAVASSIIIQNMRNYYYQANYYYQGD